MESGEKIPASELILHQDGSVYHLNIKPEHLADTVILVGDPHRVEMISNYFDRIEFKGENREIVTHTDHTEIRDSLRNIDRYIYGDVKGTPLHKEFERLLDFSIDRYREKLIEYGHAE